MMITLVIPSTTDLVRGKREILPIPEDWIWVCDILRPGLLAICIFFTDKGYIRVQEEGSEWPDTETIDATGSSTIMF